ncbi:hypothetical protein BBK36DRAFT_1113038, partial [Trichoderma citrinoviride]
DPDSMEKRIKKHVEHGVKKLNTHVYDLEDAVEAGTKSERKDIRAISQQLKEAQEKIDNHLDDIKKGMEQQLELVQKLGPLIAETARNIELGRKRSAAEAFRTDEDDIQIRTRTGLFQQLERRLAMHLSNTQTHIESAVYEMKSGTFKRLADLDERIGAIEEKMDRMARFMAKWEAVSSANAGSSGLESV